MDSYHVYSLKIAKSNAILKRDRLRKIRNILRLIEICIFLVLMSRFTTHLPAAVKNSGKYFWDISVILVSPHFVFLLGNAIVITLFAKSGGFTGQYPEGISSENDLYDKFVEKSRSTQLSDIKYHKKRDPSKGSLVTGTARKPRMIRSRSEKLNQRNKHHQRSELVLRRSETDKCITTVSIVEESEQDLFPEDNMSNEQDLFPEDNMSNEEFRCMVEAFIARQQKLIMKK